MEPGTRRAVLPCVADPIYDHQAIQVAIHLRRRGSLYSAQISMAGHASHGRVILETSRSPARHISDRGRRSDCKPAFQYGASMVIPGGLVSVSVLLFDGRLRHADPRTDNCGMDQLGALFGSVGYAGTRDARRLLVQYLPLAAGFSRAAPPVVEFAGIVYRGCSVVFTDRAADPYEPARRPQRFVYPFVYSVDPFFSRKRFTLPVLWFLTVYRRSRIKEIGNKSFDIDT